MVVRKLFFALAISFVLIAAPTSVRAQSVPNPYINTVPQIEIKPDERPLTSKPDPMVNGPQVYIEPGGQQGFDWTWNFPPEFNQASPEKQSEYKSCLETEKSAINNSESLAITIDDKKNELEESALTACAPLQSNPNFINEQNDNTNVNQANSETVNDAKKVASKNVSALNFKNASYENCLSRLRAQNVNTLNTFRNKTNLDMKIKCEQKCKQVLYKGIKENDQCGASILYALLTKNTQYKNIDEINKMLDPEEPKGEDLRKQRQALRKEYGCTDRDKKISYLDQGIGLANSAMQVLAVNEGGKAYTNTIEKTANSKSAADSFKTGNEEMAKAYDNSAKQEGTNFLMKAATAAAAYKLYKDQNKALKNVENMEIKGGGGYRDSAEAQDTYSINQAVGKIQNKDGSEADIEEEINKHRAVKEKAMALLGKSTIETLRSGQSALNYKNAAKQLKNANNQLTDAQQQNNVGLNPFAGLVQNNAENPTYNAVTPYAGQQESAITSQDTPGAEGGGGVGFPDQALGPETSGGLKDAPMAPSDNWASVSGGGGGGGGGGGSVGVDGGGGGGDSEGPGGSQGTSGGVSKFEGTGGNGFVAAGGGKKGGGDTGEMSLNSLLEKFLPGNAEEKKDGSGILEFSGAQGPAGRGVASVADDGSILGPNSNLFLRVTNTMTANFKKGNLK